MNIINLDGAFGKEINNLDLSKVLSKDEIRKVILTFHENGLIRIPGQKLKLKEFERSAEMFGEIKPHFLDHLRFKGHPGILLLSNIMENDQPIGIYEGAAFWHTDVAYEDPPNTATVVYGKKWPTEGCPTHFSSTYAAYDALTDVEKKEFESLKVIHHYGNRSDMDENSKYSAEKLTEEQKKKIQNVYQPLVKTHPVTKRKALYGIAGSSFGIVGMPENEAINLLDELKKHALKPQFRTTVDIKKGEVVAWDAYCTLHKATPQKIATGENDARLLWRASMVGTAPVLEKYQSL